VEVRFHKQITDNFVFFQDQLETNLLQLFAHPQNSEWFSITFAIIFQVNIVAAQIQAQLVTNWFLQVSIALKSFAAPPPALPLFRRPWPQPNCDLCFVINGNVWCKHTFPPMATVVALHHKHLKLAKPFTPHVIAWSDRKGFSSVYL